MRHVNCVENKCSLLLLSLPFRGRPLTRVLHNPLCLPCRPGAPEYELLETLEEVKAAAADPEGLKERAPVVVCTFSEYFPAVAATDILCRAVDVLACKPSELAFYRCPS